MWVNNKHQKLVDNTYEAWDALKDVISDENPRRSEALDTALWHLALTLESALAALEEK